MLFSMSGAPNEELAWKHREAGSIWVGKDHRIHYRWREFTWDLNIGRLKFVGEYTTDLRLSLDDWYLVLVTDERWFEVPVYAVGWDAFREQLEEALQAPVQPGLACSTDLESRILWPAEWCGQTLFDLTPSRHPGVLGWLRSQLLPLTWMSLTLPVLMRAWGLNRELKLALPSTVRSPERA